MSLLDKLKKFDEKPTVEKEIIEKKAEPIKKKSIRVKKEPKKVEIPDINKSIELNSLKTLYANRFGTTTNMKKADMQKALIKIWNKENKRVGK